ncbi:hypothetical protein CVT24_010832 [Panaeolus cyanescens]|uniref:Chromatin elongation factor spt5 n=1 Tax=Panaeolus cyanescens TaxID=181874 RepID=A0A409WQI6_9AGAR|nr:hypothetical protein CVT24_010832 [Panaeolus cyanescens]
MMYDTRDFDFYGDLYWASRIDNTGVTFQTADHAYFMISGKPTGYDHVERSITIRTRQFISTSLMTAQDTPDSPPASTRFICIDEERCSQGFETIYPYLPLAASVAIQGQPMEDREKEVGMTDEVFFGDVHWEMDTTNIPPDYPPVVFLSGKPSSIEYEDNTIKFRISPSLSTICEEHEDDPGTRRASSLFVCKYPDQCPNHFMRSYPALRDSSMFLPQAVNRFLDLEAEVDVREEEEVEESDADADFLDDEYNLDVEDHSIYLPPQRLFPGDDDSASSFEEPRAKGVVTDGEAELDLGRDGTLGTILALEQERSLWRFQCSPKSQWATGHRLCSSLEGLDEFRDICINPCIPNWIYLDADMVPEVFKRVNATLGLYHNSQGVIMHAIDAKTWNDAVTTSPNRHLFRNCTWVRVRGGAYDGDVAFVCHVGEDVVDVLLIPRVNYSPRNNKRKKTRTRPQPALFRPEDYVHGRLQVSHRGERRYAVGVNEFEFGLLRKTVDTRSLSSEKIGMTSWQCGTFLSSGHPSLHKCAIPYLVGWNISEGDTVRHPHGIEAVVLKVEENVATLRSCEDGEEFVSAWNDVVKVCKVGDFIEVKSGQHTGRSGWVIAVFGDSGDTLMVLDIVSRNDDPVEFKIFSNWVILSSPPMNHVLQPSLLVKKLPKDVLPWINARVRVTKFRHAFRSRVGFIQGISFDSTTESITLQVVIDDSYDPNHPYPVVTLDFYDVVGAQSNAPLNRAFQPSRGIPSGTERNTVKTVAGTPTWNSHHGASMTSPAFNPHALTPIWNPSWENAPALNPYLSTETEAQSSPPSSSSLSSNPSPPAHPFLRKELIGIGLCASVNGGTYSNMKCVVNVREQNGRLSLYHHMKNVNRYLEPDWVKPTHPNPVKTTSRLVVISDNKPGTFVRPFRGYKPEKPPLMTVAIVEHTPGSVDKVIGDAIYSAEELCATFETRDDQALHRDMAKKLRDRAMFAPSQDNC